MKRSILMVAIVLTAVISLAVAGGREVVKRYEIVVPDYLTTPEDRADEMTNAALKTFHRMTSGLIWQLRNEDLPNMAKVRIIYLLGELRPVRAITVLVKNINLHAERMDPKSRIGRWGPYPARGALVKIGSRASWGIMGMIASPKFDRAKVDGYAAVLASIERPRYALMKLEERLERAKDEKEKEQYRLVIQAVTRIVKTWAK